MWATTIAQGFHHGNGFIEGTIASSQDMDLGILLFGKGFAF